MEPLIQMELVKDIFSKTDLKIYNKIKEEPSYVASSNIVGLAEWCEVSQPSITRFCKKIGFKKFTDFKSSMYRSILMGRNHEQKDSVPSLLHHYQELLSLTEHVLTNEVMEDLTKYIFSFKHIFVTGISESFFPAKLLEFKFRNLGLYISAIPNSELHDIFNYVQSEDLIIIFSVRGGNGRNSLKSFFSEVDNEKVLLITMNMNSKYKDVVDKILVLPNTNYNNAINRTKTDILFYVFIETLVSYIAFK